MTLGGVRIKLPILAFSGLTAISLAGLLLLPPIPQDQSYHQFADQRTIFGIPNFWNVVSNLPFLAVGAAGLWRFRQDAATVVFFLGVFLTGLGSSYYHLNPHDGTLFWDRLPMTLSFAAILALVVGERITARAGVILLWPALAVGVFSLLLWRWTGDLRLYFWVQFFPGLAVLSLFVLAPAKYTGTHYWVLAGALYAVAKVLEFTDRAVYSAGTLLSGHPFKHLVAAAACFAMLWYFRTRQPTPPRTAGTFISAAQSGGVPEYCPWRDRVMSRRRGGQGSEQIGVHAGSISVANLSPLSAIARGPRRLLAVRAPESAQSRRRCDASSLRRRPRACPPGPAAA